MALISKTFSSAGNRKTWTWSAWLKIIGDTSKNYTLMTQVDGWSANGNAGFYLNGESLQAYNFLSNVNAGTSSRVSTTAYLRDPNAWYHVVLRFDTTQSSASDRVRWYINGELQTDLVHANYPSQNFDANFNTAAAHGIGRHTDSNTYPYEGAMSHIHFCDGYSYAPTEFGETDSTTGIWKIKTSPSVSYGTNGFFILKDGNSVTDQSGQSNDWTVSAGTITDLKDNPSNVVATGNPLNFISSGCGLTFEHGNNTIQNDCAVGNVATLGASSGKYYWEGKLISFVNSGGSGPNVYQIGINGTIFSKNTQFSGSSNPYGYSYLGTGDKRNNGSSSSFGNTYTNNDIIGVAMDLDNNKLYFSKNGTWQNSGDPTSGSTGTGSAYTITAASSTDSGFYFPCYGHRDNRAKWSMNFGNGYFGTTAVSSAQNPDDGVGIFEYDVPAGYRALCTKSLNAEEYS